MSGYCDYAPGNPIHASYHDEEYGFPLTDETALFERLVLEIAQAGLSWELILKKREGFRRRLAGFDVDRVAAFGSPEIESYLGDPEVIRNRLKIQAFIHNAKVIQGLRESHGSFLAWIEAQHPLAKEDWVKLFRKTFKFMGPEIVGEFLMSTGVLPGAHRDDCPTQKRVLAAKPMWKR
jgi:DNA-3-methyladenine glycosylase I